MKSRNLQARQGFILRQNLPKRIGQGYLDLQHEGRWMALVHQSLEFPDPDRIR
jgi:hypothetical protein